ncbi:MAG: histidinol-phosphate transaminase [Anaerolineae bacterium]|nr:histidinol-phosphate transaminase [Anaerolineae bacterium]
MSVESLVRPDIAGMEEYTPILPFEVLSAQLGIPEGALVKIDANENPYGPSPAVWDAVAAARLHIYPDPESRYLREALVDYAGVPFEYIMAGAGADELIDLLFRALIMPGDVIINCPPTFGMYSFDGALGGARVVEVWRLGDFAPDVPAIETAAHATGAKLLVLCSPNNPDGSLLALETLDRLLRLPLVVLLDEAYVEFSGTPGYIARVPDAPNLVVLRTFSKWAGLAGLRVGYGAFPLWLMKHLWKIKQPYNVNVAAAAAARASLADRDTLRANVEKIVLERARLYRALAEIDYLHPYPSRSNFVLCRVEGGRDAKALKRALAARGVLVRYFDKPGLRNHIRVSAGKPEHTDALLAALKEL